ncbi:MAG: RCC1 domain-containing protein [Lachnospiraceae bacterium]|nr:RCC1 domain-containing protein [Lachnospiraceae bacterium]MCI2195549.1 RCC1 domain-containing protein [Lachnospiraceae bacterium]
MGERYTIIARLKPNEYIDGCPVILKNGALLLDTITNKILAQLKFQIVSEKRILLADISIQEQDVVGKVLGIQKYEYLDISSNIGECFGEQVPVYLEHTNARSCSISVEKVVFDDHSEWVNTDNAFFQALPERKAFSEDHEVIQQLQIDINSKARYHPHTTDDLWMCTCGTYNKNERKTCSHCHAAKDLVFSVSPDKLKEERKACVESKRTTRKSKTISITLVSLVIIIVIFSLLSVWLNQDNSNTTKTGNAQNDGVSVNTDKDSADADKVSADGAYAVQVLSDGTVSAFSGNSIEDLNKQLDNWTDIKSVAVGPGSVIGLKNDGTVVGCMIHDSGIEDCGQTDVDDWSGVVAIAAGDYNTVGLLEDGTVISTDITDNQYDFGQTKVDSWGDIKELSASKYHTVGLKNDGTVISTEITGIIEDYGQTDVSDWDNIESISASDYSTVGLKQDGTVVSTEIDTASPDYDTVNCGQTAVGNFEDIVAVATGAYHTVGLKRDGTVVSTKISVSDNDYGQTEVDNWPECRTITANDYGTIGITKKDGKTISTVDD